jgi:hypothetical protein
VSLIIVSHARWSSPHASPRMFLTPTNLHGEARQRPTIVELSWSQPCDSNGSEPVEISSPFPFAIPFAISHLRRTGDRLWVFWSSTTTTHCCLVVPALRQQRQRTCGDFFAISFAISHLRLKGGSRLRLFYEVSPFPI